MLDYDAHILLFVAIQLKFKFSFSCSTIFRGHGNFFEAHT